MTKIMGILNLTPDSFWAPSRCKADEAGVRIGKMLEAGADIIDIGAVSTRPSAPEVSLEEEWRRLRPVLPFLKGVVFSVDTVRAEIVRRVFEEAGPFIVNDISSGEDDPAMLPTVAGLKLGYVAMHKRGCPQTMDALCDYPDGVVPEVMRYFRNFSSTAERLGIRDWVLDPGFGFAKTEEQNIELLEHLRPHYKMYILSNGFREVQSLKLENSGLAPYFDGIVLSEDAKVQKPHPGIFDYALRVTGSSRESTLMIGDSWDADILGAHDSAIDQIWYNPQQEPARGFRPTYTVVTLAEITHIL